MGLPTTVVRGTGLGIMPTPDVWGRWTYRTWAAGQGARSKGVSDQIGDEGARRQVGGEGEREGGGRRWGAGAATIPVLVLVQNIDWKSTIQT